MNIEKSLARSSVKQKKELETKCIGGSQLRPEMKEHRNI